MRGKRYPFQLTFVSNSEDDDFWLSREFPTDNRIKGRTLYQISVFDNKHADPESIASLLRQWPEDHPKHRTMILGRRGPKVQGVPVFEGLYRKDLHWRKVPFHPEMPIYESIQCGKHNPAWVYGQPLQSGGFAVLGGLLGLGMVLDDFLPIVELRRREWYPPAGLVKMAVAPMGGGSTTGLRYTLLDIIKRHIQLTPVCRDDGNAPDVRVAILENLAGYLRRRNSNGEEAFAIDSDPLKFEIVSREEYRHSPIVHHAFEGGATWDDHFVSVGNKEVRQMREDDKFANILHCLENIELNFLAGKKLLIEPEPATSVYHGPRSPWN